VVGMRAFAAQESRRERGQSFGKQKGSAEVGRTRWNPAGKMVASAIRPRPNLAPLQPGGSRSSGSAPLLSNLEDVEGRSWVHFDLSPCSTVLPSTLPQSISHLGTGMVSHISELKLSGEAASGPSSEHVDGSWYTVPK
jgi:hypothetical protein